MAGSARRRGAFSKSPPTRGKARPPAPPAAERPRRRPLLRHTLRRPGWPPPRIFAFRWRRARSIGAAATASSARTDPQGEHAGCDLYAPLNTPIYAIANGVLIRDPSILSTSERTPSRSATGACSSDTGDRRGQLQARRRPNGPARAALRQDGAMPRHLAADALFHFELYTNGRDSSSLWGKKLPPYMRRDDVTDPARTSTSGWSTCRRAIRIREGPRPLPAEGMRFRRLTPRRAPRDGTVDVSAWKRRRGSVSCWSDFGRRGFVGQGWRLEVGGGLECR